MSDAIHGAGGALWLALILALCASVVSVGLWLSALVAQAVCTGWKKVEYIYTEREKSFVGITIVFVILRLRPSLPRRPRSPWQLDAAADPFLTLTNSYLTLLAHAFGPRMGRQSHQPRAVAALGRRRV